MRRPFHAALFALALAGPFAGAVLVPMPAAAQQPAAATAQAVADHFSSVRSMTGNFIQFDAAGNQSEGTFSIERPGKIRFDYSGQPLRVIADGSQVAINNSRLNTWDLYPLSQTPMKLLLDRRIDLSAANIQDVQQTPELITIVMGDRSVFGSSRITMMFDPNTYDLRQWTIRDQQGKDTTVIIDNVREGVAVDQAQFAIPYNQISQQSRGRIGGGR
jgi:outer membrane lipoprotein-sorting protein